MALTKLTANVANIIGLDDNPNEGATPLSSTELKNTFDKAGTDIKNYINNTLTEELDTKLDTTSSDIGTLSNLETTTKTDVVSAINEVNGKAADYIIETGTTDGWKWRKWNSGRVEMTGWNQFTGIKLDRASNGTYYSDTTGYKTLTLPFSLSSVDYLGATETSSRASGVYVYYTRISGSTLTTEFRAFANIESGPCGVMYYIIGTI